MSLQRILRYLVCLGPLLLLWACQTTRPPQTKVETTSAPPYDVAPSAIVTSEMVVASARVPGEVYKLDVGPCQGQLPALQCALSVRLMAGSEVVTTLALDPVWSDSIEPLAPSSERGMGDPLGRPQGWKAWRIGRGDDAVVVGASPIRLGPRQEGLLLRRVYRGDARHVIVARRESSLSAVEIAGRWSDLAVDPRGTERDQLVLFARWPGEPGFVWASEPIWDERTENLLFDSRHDPEAYLVATGPYASQQEAMNAAEATCLPGAVSVPTDPYAGVAPGGFLAAVVTGKKELGQQALESLKHCASSPLAIMVPLRFRWVPQTRYPLADAKRVEIGLDAFDGRGWPLTLKLVAGDQVLDVMELEWAPSVPVMNPAIDVDLPGGDPLRPWRGETGWAMGDSQTAALTAIRSLRLKDGRPALLVSVEAGFEQRKRRHEIVTIDDDHFYTAWQAVDPEGPAWSTVVSRKGRDGTDEIIHFSFFEDSMQGNIDRADVARIAWDDEKRTFTASAPPCDGSVTIVVLAAFARLEQALAAKEHPCPASVVGPASERPQPLVLQAPRGSGLRGYVLAYLTTDKPAARQLVTEAAKCRPKAHPSVFPWCLNPNSIGGLFPCQP